MEEEDVDAQQDASDKLQPGLVAQHQQSGSKQQDGDAVQAVPLLRPVGPARHGEAERGGAAVVVVLVVLVLVGEALIFLGG